MSGILGVIDHYLNCVWLVVVLQLLVIAPKQDQLCLGVSVYAQMSSQSLAIVGDVLGRAHE